MLPNEIHLSLDGPTCPKCQTGTLLRSASRTFFERLRKRLTSKRLHRCTNCSWRGWARPSEAGVGIKTSVMWCEPPSMEEIDNALAPILRPIAKPQPSETADVKS